ncbi:hypothetical protein Gpo141_00000291 [Globisporangium polare]
MALKTHAFRTQRRGIREQQSERRGGDEGLSAIERLQRAMEHHAALQDDALSFVKPRATPIEKMAKDVSPMQQQKQPSKPAASTPESPSAVSSVAALAEQLQSLWRHEPRETSGPLQHHRRRAVDEAMMREYNTVEEEDEDAKPAEVHQQRRQHAASAPAMDSSSSSPPPPLLANALLKIGSDEKDELLMHLLQQVAFFRGQLSEVATLGETIAAQLVHQQHGLRVKHREQMTRLEQQLHDATHSHPRVLGLERKVEELEASNREKDQQLRFAVQKLQRSRQREKELKTMQDPLWDI